MNSKQKFFLVFAAAVAVFLLIVLIQREVRQQWLHGLGTSSTFAATEKPLLPSSTAQPSSSQPTDMAAPVLTVEHDLANTPQPAPPEVPDTSRPEVPSEFYVAVDGNKEGDGSIDQPWPLQYALNHPVVVKPGDTIWVRGGLYEGKFVIHLKGAEDGIITVRSYPGERAILSSADRVLDISTSHYVNLWGLEITASENSRDPYNRPETAYGIRINQGKESHHIKFINMIIHDMPAQGMGWWRANTDSEVYGSLVYYNGVNQFDHGIYANNEVGQKRIIDSIIFDNASHGIHAYGSDTQPLNYLHIEGNTVFNNGSIGYSTTNKTYGTYKRNILVGGYMIAEDPVILDNFTYYPGDQGAALNLGYRAGSINAIVESNYFAGGRIELGGENEQMRMEANTILGIRMASLLGVPFPGNEMILDRKGSTRIFVRPNQYEPGRANITIYNWEKRDIVRLTAMDLQGVEIKQGDQYELHNVQDFFGDIIMGTYDGEGIDIPMTGHSVAQPLGLSFKPGSTFPEFGAFVLLPR